MTQATLIDVRATGPVVTERDRILAALAAKQQAWFRARAEGFVLAALRQDGPQPGEALVSAARAAGIVPVGDDRAFGPVFQRLARSRQIVAHGYCRRAKGRGTHGGVVWALAQ